MNVQWSIIAAGYKALRSTCTAEEREPLEAAMDALRLRLADIAPAPNIENRGRAPKDIPPPPVRFINDVYGAIDDVVCDARTLRAILVRHEASGWYEWFPVSTLHSESPVQYKDNRGAVVLTRFILQGNGVLR